MGGGILTPSDKIGFFNTETKLGRVFDRCCTYDYIDYGEGRIDIDQEYYFFVEASSFYRLCAEHVTESPPRENDVHLSPYMQIMVNVAREMNITPENQPRKIDVEERLKAHWPRGLTQSENLIKAMATLLREPESQLGRAKKP